MALSFVARGIGRGIAICFCCNPPTKDCGGDDDFVKHELAAFTKDYEMASRIKALFISNDSNCYVDYRDYEPHRVQIKVGACDKHLENLKNLQKITSEDKTISGFDIVDSLSITSKDDNSNE